MAKNPRKYEKAAIPPNCAAVQLGDVTIDSVDIDFTDVIQAINESAWQQIVCPPCILVNGEKQDYVTIWVNPVTGETRYTDVNGTILDPATIELVTDLCDPRCDCTPCDEEPVDEVCCSCSTKQQQATIAEILADIYSTDPDPTCGIALNLPPAITIDVTSQTPCGLGPQLPTQILNQN